MVAVKVDSCKVSHVRIDNRLRSPKIVFLNHIDFIIYIIREYLMTPQKYLVRTCHNIARLLDMPYQFASSRGNMLYITHLILSLE